MILLNAHESVAAVPFDKLYVFAAFPNEPGTVALRAWVPHPAGGYALGAALIVQRAADGRSAVVRFAASGEFDLTFVGE